MGSMVSGLADAVLGVAEGVGLSSDTVARYRKCCGVVVKFCDRRDLDALSVRVVDEFVACQQERARRGEIGPNRRNALVKSARMMLEFQATGAVAWRMMSPDPDLTLSDSSRDVLEQFAVAAGLELAPGSVRLLASEIRQFLGYLDRIGRGALGTVTADDVRGFMVEMAPRRPAGTANVVWSLKRFFAFLNIAGLSDVRIDGLLAHAAPRRVRRCRALPVRSPAVSLRESRPGPPAGRGTPRWSCSRSRPGCAAATSSHCAWTRSTGVMTRSGWSRPRHPGRWCCRCQRWQATPSLSGSCTAGPIVTPRKCSSGSSRRS